MMKTKIPFLASVLAAILMGLPPAAVMHYAERKTDIRRTELAERGTTAALNAFITEHQLSKNDLRFMVSHKRMSFSHTWLSYAASIGVTAAVFLLLRNLCDRMIKKRESPNQASDATSEPAPGAASSAHQG